MDLLNFLIKGKLSSKYRKYQNSDREVFMDTKRVEENAKKILKDVVYCAKPYQTAEGADALLIHTEWDEFRNIDLEKVKEALKNPLIFDGRNIYSHEVMKKHGFKYYPIGRKIIK